MKRLSWTSLTIIIGLPVQLGFIAWLIWILSAADKWCGVHVTDDKLASRPIADCSSIEMQLIHWLGWYGIALIVCICVSFLTIVVRDLKAAIDLTGLAGTHLKVGGDDAAAGAAATADAAVDRAAEIAGGT